MNWLVFTSLLSFCGIIGGLMWYNDVHRDSPDSAVAIILVAASAVVLSICGGIAA